MLFSLLKDDANTAVAREHVLDILTLPLSSSSSSFPQSLLLLLLLLRKRCAQNKEKKREKRERCVCVCPTFEKQANGLFWLKNLARGAKIALFWFQNQTDRGRIFGSKIIRQTEGAFLVQNHQTERRIFGLFFFYFLLPLRTRFSGGVDASFFLRIIHSSKQRARAHARFLRR